MSRGLANLGLGVALAAAAYAFMQVLKGNQVLAAVPPAGAAPSVPGGLLPLQFASSGTGSSPGFFSPSHSGGATVTPVASPSVTLPAAPAPASFPFDLAPVFREPVHQSPIAAPPQSGPSAPVTPVASSPLGEVSGGGSFFDPFGTAQHHLPSVPASPAPVPRPKPQGLISEDQDIMARTIYGEARSEGRAGMEAVASVIMNRVRSRRFPSSAKAVCLQPYQFSAWNSNDPQRPIMLALDPANPNALFAECLEVAGNALAGRLADSTNGADHYWAEYIATPYWAKPDVSPKLQHTAKIGRHIFVKGVA